MKRLVSLAVVLACPLLASSLTIACSSSSSPAAPATDAGADAGARTYTMLAPDSYAAGTPTPLVILLHGYAVNGALESGYMRMDQAAQAKGFLFVYADGTPDSTGSLFWNATDACCNFDDNPVDDVAFIDWIISDVSSKYSVDPKRVFLVGHSNGGFMAHRYACDRASKVAAIVALAGDVWNDPTKCNPSEPVAIAQAHGDADEVIAYDGGTTQSGVFPSAHQSVATWAAKNACTGALTQTGTLDLDSVLAGSETKVEAYGSCATGGAAELWTIQGGTHIPNLGTSWGDAVWAFFSAHPKP